MRKLLLVLCALCVSFGPAVPVGADPGAGTWQEYAAFADWIDMHGKTGTYHAAGAIRYVHEEEGLITRAGVSKGKCHRTRSGDWIMITCGGRGKSKVIPLTDFQIDPLFNSATVDVHVAGYDNHVSWTGRGSSPQISQGASVGTNWAYGQAAMYRDARTEGKVLGSKMRSSGWMDWGYMVLAAGAVAYADVGGLQVEMAPDGTFTFERRIRIPA